MRDTPCSSGPRAIDAQTGWRCAVVTAALLALLSTGVGVGCSRPEAATGLPGKAREHRTVRISGDDSMQFSEMTIEARPGEVLRVEFSNTGTRPKDSMGHNWVLLRPATPEQVNEFGLAAASAPPKYLPADRKRQIIAATRMLGPGETDAIEVIVPSEPGEYPYICTFPGHFMLMKGWLVVKL